MTKEELSALCRKEFANPEMATPCWFHPNKPMNTSGYVQIEIDGWRGYIHVLAYLTEHDRVPDGMEVDHTCNPKDGTHTNRACCNPEHLEAVIPLNNKLRGRKANQTHCKRGHEFTPENTRVQIRPSNGREMRICRKCQLEYAKNRYAKNGDKMREIGREYSKRYRQENADIVRAKDRERDKEPGRKLKSAQFKRDQRGVLNDARFQKRNQEVRAALDAQPKLAE
jgi:hypothetical protein